MAELGQEQVKEGVFGGVELQGNIGINENVTEGAFGGMKLENTEAGTIRQAGSSNNLPVKQGFWSKFKAFWFQDIDWNREIKVELTPKQQKVEDEINEFLHQEITWGKVHDFLFQEINFGKRK